MNTSTRRALVLTAIIACCMTACGGGKLQLREGPPPSLSPSSLTQLDIPGAVAVGAEVDLIITQAGVKLRSRDSVARSTEETPISAVEAWSSPPGIIEVLDAGPKRLTLRALEPGDVQLTLRTEHHNDVITLRVRGIARAGVNPLIPELISGDRGVVGLEGGTALMTLQLFDSDGLRLMRQRLPTARVDPPTAAQLHLSENPQQDVLLLELHQPGPLNVWLNEGSLISMEVIPLEGVASLRVIEQAPVAPSSNTPNIDANTFRVLIPHAQTAAGATILGAISRTETEVLTPEVCVDIRATWRELKEARETGAAKPKIESRSATIFLLLMELVPAFQHIPMVYAVADGRCEVRMRLGAHEAHHAVELQLQPQP